MYVDWARIYEITHKFKAKEIMEEEEEEEEW